MRASAAGERIRLPFPTLPAAVRHHAEQGSTSRIYVVADEETVLSYGDLWRRSGCCAAALAARARTSRRR